MGLRESLEYKAIELGRLAVQMTSDAGTGHPSSALSLMHLVTVLMYRTMRWDPQNPWDHRADRLVLSEGHAVPIVYAAGIDLGLKVGRSPAQSRNLTMKDLPTLRQADSVLDGHPNPVLGFPFFDAATGSLGQGLSVGAGLALAAKLHKSKRRVFVICGDGEMREGQVAEAVDFIDDHKPGNLVLIVNCNHMGQSDYVSHQQSPEVLKKKFKAAGWLVRDIDGHNVEQIDQALRTVPKSRPVVVLARTVKGWGVKELQAVDYHGKSLTADDCRQALEALQLPSPKPAEVLAPPKPQGRAVEFRQEITPLGPPDFSKALKDGQLSTRKAYGLALRALGEKNPQVVALDGDVQHSTFADYFAAAFPERFFECKIAEQNMVSAGGGLAAGGMLPFANTFGKFVVRAYDQLEMAAISGFNLKIAGSHSGVTLAADGPSQMALVDLPFIRALAHARLSDGREMAIMLMPSDAVSAWRSVELAARHNGLVYIRTLRPDLPLLYKLDEQFEIGGAKVLREGDDLTLAGSCYTVHIALRVAERLAKEGLSCRVIDCYCLPLRDERVLGMVRDPRSKILALDDSYVGSVGSELAEVAAACQGAKVVTMAVERTPKSARKPEEVLAQVGLGEEAVYARARELAKGK